MISFIFKFSITFIFSFVLLSFKFDNKSLFYHLSEIAGPLGVDVQESLGKSVKRSLSKTEEFGKNLIKNADPKYAPQLLEDEINSSRSALGHSREKELILEEIRKDEAKILDELIKKN